MKKTLTITLVAAAVIAAALLFPWNLDVRNRDNLANRIQCLLCDKNKVIVKGMTDSVEIRLLGYDKRTIFSNGKREAAFPETTGISVSSSIAGTSRLAKPASSTQTGGRPTISFSTSRKASEISPFQPKALMRQAPCMSASNTIPQRKSAPAPTFPEQSPVGTPFSPSSGTVAVQSDAFS
ncbi:MAG: hypothetical protein J6S82_10430 [Bacteroidales bacterium]|nr:hypothetical protein [Bacteroidales bacterium]